MYTIDTPTDEPVEVRIALGQHQHVLIAYRADNGTVGYDLTSPRSSYPESLSTLQSKGTFPRKAVPGWQLEVIAFARDGLGTITEIR